jgi:hypothetical protein
MGVSELTAEEAMLGWGSGGIPDRRLDESITESGVRIVGALMNPGDEPLRNWLF